MKITLPQSVALPEFTKFLTEFQSYPEINATIALNLALKSTVAQFELADAKKNLYKLKEEKDAVLKAIFSQLRLDNKTLRADLSESAARAHPDYKTALIAAAEVEADYNYVVDLLKQCEQLHYYFKDLYKSDTNVGSSDNHSV